VGAGAGYAIDVTAGSTNNLIQGDVTEGNADEGIHLASGTSSSLTATDSTGTEGSIGLLLGSKSAPRVHQVDTLPATVQ
jgi:hypothetical protein